jgi:hypothetical protein
MAEPARRAVVTPDEPPVDPAAIDRAYHLYRAKRRAQAAHAREQARARLRFLVAIVVLIVLALVLFLTLWREIQHVFGL